MSKIRVPSTYDCVYKDECVYSFDTPVNLHLRLFDKRRRITNAELYTAKF